jgi:hypothetical protein
MKDLSPDQGSGRSYGLLQCGLSVEQLQQENDHYEHDQDSDY